MTSPNAPYGEGRASDTVPHSSSDIPSSATEVSIRTLRSDIEQMGRGGGVMPSLERFSVPSIPLPRSTSASPRKSGLIWYLIFGVVGAIFLFAIGFFLYPFLIKEDAPASPVAPARTEEKQLAPTSTTPQAPASFFVNPVTGAVLNIDVATGTPSALIPGVVRAITPEQALDRKSTRLNSSHLVISYSLFFF